MRYERFMMVWVHGDSVPVNIRKKVIQMDYFEAFVMEAEEEITGYHLLLQGTEEMFYVNERNIIAPAFATPGDVVFGHQDKRWYVLQRLRWDNREREVVCVLERLGRDWQPDGLVDYKWWIFKSYFTHEK